MPRRPASDRVGFDYFLDPPTLPSISTGQPSSSAISKRRSPTSGAQLTTMREGDSAKRHAAAGSVPYDTPSLLRVAETAPYLHDGRARTLEVIFAKYNPTGGHGAAADLSPDQLRDLLEYLRSL